MNYNWNGVIDFLKQQIKDCNHREDQWQVEKLEYQVQQYYGIIRQKKVQEQEEELDEVKGLNFKLMERLKSIQFAFQPLTENIKKSLKTTKVGHHRVKSDMDHKHYPYFQSTQPIIKLPVQNEIKKEKNALLVNSFLRDLEIEDKYSFSPTQSLISPTQSLNIQIQPNKGSQILINQTNYSTFNQFMTSSLQQTPSSAVLAIQKKQQKHHNHQRSNSNGLIISHIKSQSKLNSCLADMVVGQNLFELQCSLRSHMDGVRSVILDEEYLVSGSEDCTIKIWDCRKFSQTSDSFHMDPMITIRQNLGPIMSLTSFGDFIKNNMHFYSAGVDGIIYSHFISVDHLDNDRISEESIVWNAHQDVIWQIKHHPSEQRLLSVSADATIKMWNSINYELYSQTAQPKPLATFIFRSGLSIPTSVDWILNDQKIICGYNDSQNFVIFDLENAKICSQVKFINENIDQSCGVQPNKILFHQHKNVAIAGHDDNKIRFCDIRSGKVVKCLFGHTDSVTDITILPMNQDQIASVSHDGSMRTWDIRKFQCIHEIPAHKRKYDEAVHAVVANKSYVATGGADGIVKLFTQFK